MESSVNSFSINWLSIFMHGGPIGITISLLLIILSFWVWISIFSKSKTLQTMYLRSEKFLGYFWEAKSLSELNLRVKEIPYSPAREIFRSGFNEMIRVLQTREKKNATGPIIFDTVKRSLIRQKMMEESYLSSRMSILAVCASAAPFIGLFGTVIGIIRSFHDIGASGASSLAAVAPGVSEALVATALGLFVAIPAVTFYNILSSKIRKHLVLLDGFSSDFLNILERHYTIQKNGSPPSRE
jgi:biopolymer transport protein TolQ